MTGPAWTTGMRDLIGAFPGVEVAPERADVYHRQLVDLADEQWFHAVTEATKRETWFPTIARLRDYAAEVQIPRSSAKGPAGPIVQRPFWDSVEQQDRTEAWVRANPRRPGEGWLSYTHRIAVGAGLMQDFTAPQGHVLDGRTTREPGEDG